MLGGPHRYYYRLIFYEELLFFFVNYSTESFSRQIKTRYTKRTVFLNEMRNNKACEFEILDSFSQSFVPAHTNVYDGLLKRN